MGLEWQRVKRQRSLDRLAALIESDPGRQWTATELMKEVGLAQSTTGEYLNELVKTGRIDASRSMRCRTAMIETLIFSSCASEALSGPRRPVVSEARPDASGKEGDEITAFWMDRRIDQLRAENHKLRQMIRGLRYADKFRREVGAQIG